MIGCKWSEAVSRSNTAQYRLSRCHILSSLRSSHNPFLYPSLHPSVSLSIPLTPLSHRSSFIHYSLLITLRTSLTPFLSLSLSLSIHPSHPVTLLPSIPQFFYQFLPHLLPYTPIQSVPPFLSLSFFRSCSSHSIYLTPIHITLHSYLYSYLYSYSYSFSYSYPLSCLCR